MRRTFPSLPRSTPPTVVAAIFSILVACLAIGWMVTRHVRLSDYLEISDLPQKADVIIVPSGDDDARLAKASRLYAQGYAPKIIMSGFYKPFRARDRFAREHGISKDAVIVEPDANSTYENATFSAPVLRSQNVRTAILVTSWYHSRRATQTFRHVVPDVRFVSVPTERGTDPDDQRHVSAEFWKFCFYSLVYQVIPW